jgi:hypothetical protein
LSSLFLPEAFFFSFFLFLSFFFSFFLRLAFESFLLDFFESALPPRWAAEPSLLLSLLSLSLALLLALLLTLLRALFFFLVCLSTRTPGLLVVVSPGLLLLRFLIAGEGGTRVAATVDGAATLLPSLKVEGARFKASLHVGPFSDGNVSVQLPSVFGFCGKTGLTKAVAGDPFPGTAATLV